MLFRSMEQPTWRLLKTVTAMDVVYAFKRQGRTLYGFEEMDFVGFIGEGKMVLEEKEMGLWVLRERKREKKDLGVGAAMEDGGKKK